MKRWLVIVVAAGVLLPAVVAIALLARGSEEQQLTRMEPLQFPDFVYRSAKTQMGYQLAVENQGLFPRMPCYCGCGAMADNPHRNLLDCFINADGSYDPHASGCDVCVDIAVDAVRWRQEGKTTAEVRSLVDAKYQAYG